MKLYIFNFLFSQETIEDVLRADLDDLDSDSEESDTNEKKNDNNKMEEDEEQDEEMSGDKKSVY